MKMSLVMMSRRLFLLLLLLVVVVHSQRFDCSSNDEKDCVHRQSFRIRAILHGRKASPFWQQIEAAMLQAGRDMQVDLQVTLYDEYNPNQMANDIAGVGAGTGSVDALIVSIPDQTVQNAVGNLIQDTKLPVFGLNSGEKVAQVSGLLGFVAMEETLAGNEAGKYFATALQNKTSEPIVGLFINNEQTNIAMEERYLGMKTTLPSTAELTQLVVTTTTAGDGDDTMRAPILNSLQGCPFDFVQLASTATLQTTLDALAQYDCKTLLGAFDTSDDLAYTAIADGRRLAFTIAQQPHLQGSLPVVMAALYATTGKRLSEAGESINGVYLSGPRLITAATENLFPSAELQACAKQGFPVCKDRDNRDNNDEDTTVVTPAAQASSTCECTERSQIRLAGITHGHTKDYFWDEVYGAMNQAGVDFGIDLVADRPDPPTQGDEAFYDAMIESIKKHCSADGDVDGVFVTLPNERVAKAVQEACVGVLPVISINSGGDLSLEMGLLQHVGQLEFRAGKLAGQKLIDAGVTRGVCLSHVKNHSALMARCNGMQEAFNESTTAVTYLGLRDVPVDDPDEYLSIVEQAFDGDWENPGALVGGLSQLPSVLQVHEKHPDLKLGSFDAGADLFTAIDEGRALFGIDQNAYLQGYLPIPLLTWYVSTHQALINKFIESGPRFVTKSPGPDEIACQDVNFAACPDMPELDYGTVGSGGNGGGTGTGASSGSLSSEPQLRRATWPCLLFFFSWLAL